MVDSYISALENNVLYYIYWDQEQTFEVGEVMNIMKMACLCNLLYGILDLGF